MEKFLPIRVTIILLMVSVLANAGLANSNSKLNLSKRKPKAGVVKSNAESLIVEARIKAAKARALDAERRAQEAERAALQATPDAKVAKKKNAQANRRAAGG